MLGEMKRPVEQPDDKKTVSHEDIRHHVGRLPRGTMSGEVRLSNCATSTRKKGAFSAKLAWARMRRLSWSTVITTCSPPR